jgi:hypothetical protein
MRRIAAATAAVCISVLVAGCGGDPVRDLSEDVPFTPCSQVECAGTLPSGADFDIIMPADWNGTLAIFSHGLAAPGGTRSPPSASPETTETSPTSAVPGSPAPGGEEPASSAPASQSPGTPSTTGSPSPRRGSAKLAPRWAQGDRSVADVMLQAGYAIAGAAPSRSGWSVPQQVTAAEELHDYFSGHVGEPKRVYAWGESTGGLASIRLAESNPGWVSGTLALCAPLSGPVRTYNLALDVAYAVRQLLDPELTLTGFTSPEEAEQERDRALRRVRQAAEGPRAEQAKVVFIAAVGVLPTHSRTHDGASLDSQIQANVAGIENLLEQATVERRQLEADVGGNPSGNSGTDYSLRISDAQREQIDSLVPGITAKYLERLQPDRVAADPTAVERAAELGDPTGELDRPVITLHNVYDPVYVVQNESAYAAVVAGVGPEAQGNLVNLTVLPPARYTLSNPAPEGAGNCNFEPRTLFGAVVLLNRWVRGGQYPGQDSLAESFRNQQVSADFEPPPWPQMDGLAAASDSAAAGAVPDARIGRGAKVPADGTGARRRSAARR